MWNESWKTTVKLDNTSSWWNTWGLFREFETWNCWTVGVPGKEMQGKRCVDGVKKSKLFKEKLFPKIYKEDVKLFEQSNSNMLRSISVYYNRRVMVPDIGGDANVEENSKSQRRWSICWCLVCLIIIQETCTSSSTNNIDTPSPVLTKFTAAQRDIFQIIHNGNGYGFVHRCYIDCAIPSVFTKEGKEAEELSKERRLRWISAISTDECTESTLKNDRSVRTANLEQAEQRGKRTNEKERLRLEQEREHLRLEEVAAKKAKLEYGDSQPISDICFSEASTQTEEFEYSFTKQQSQSPISEDNFRVADSKVSFYTGLPSFEILSTVFRQILPFVTRKTVRLTPFEEFVLTLMKLRLNMPFEDLANRFGISVPTVSRI
ncbi:Hypothetical predicted protein [Paramuricea clavata]|uniref:Uncharacterized protein n=1 Tax=Paramuricea clavata TaxID=317549 RepID=A0A6S7FZN0_PARCT|nr:Hypothetical predicted protein [Paramuricea clavata]